MYQGFEYYDNQDGRLEKIGPRALKWLDQRDKNRPFFIFLHYYDTHAPYFSPPDYRKKFDPNPGYNRVQKIIQEVDPFWLKKVREENTPLTREDYEHISALYDGSVHWMDLNVARFLAGADQRQLLARSLIVFTSDHGECLGERGQLAHGDTLNEQLVRVPLLIKWPGGMGAGEVVRTPVSLLDLAPTLLDTAGIPVPKDWQGISLRRQPSGGEPPARILFAQLPSEKQAMALDFPYKLLLDYSTEPPSPALYQVVTDPLEMNNLADVERGKTAQLLDLIQKHLQTTPPLTKLARQAVIDTRVIEELKNLGYVEN